MQSFYSAFIIISFVFCPHKQFFIVFHGFETIRRLGIFSAMIHSGLRSLEADAIRRFGGRSAMRDCGHRAGPLTVGSGLQECEPGIVTGLFCCVRRPLAGGAIEESEPWHCGPTHP